MVRGTFNEENVHLYSKLAQGTTAEALGITATAVGAVGYFEAWVQIVITIFDYQVLLSSIKPLINSID